MSNTKTATRAQIEKIMTDLPEADRKILEAHLKGGKSRRMSEAEILGKRKHVVPGSLGFDEVKNKQFVMIACQYPGCETQRKTFTSDLHQVTMCDAHKAEQVKAKKAERDAKVKAILAKAASVEA